MTWITCLIALLMLACWGTLNWMLYVSDMNYPLTIAAVGCLVFLVGLVPFALYRKKWLAASIGLLTLLIIGLPVLKIDGYLGWIQEEGFRAHASPVDAYLSHCKLITITDDNKQQQIGHCASLNRGSHRIDVVYDTSGKVLWPSAAMSPSVKAAAAKVFPAKLITSPASRVHLFGSFYAFNYTDRND